HHRCTVTGLTLSARQLGFARNRLAQSGAARQAELRLQDYREARGPYDRIASVEMLEAVGEAYWPTYFAKLQMCLRPAGVAVLQVITINEERFAAYRRRPDFIQKYIFPGGMLPTKQIIQQQAKSAGLCLLHSEFFGESYARTIEAWQRRFRQSSPALE